MAEICAALNRLLTSPSIRTKLTIAGKIRAQQFRWDTCARRSAEFFESILGCAY